MSARLLFTPTLLATVCLIAGGGCITQFGPNLGFLAFPVPVSPWQQKKHEDEFHMHERYERVSILDPVPPGGVHAVDPPSDDQVMRVLESVRPVQGGLPLMYEVQRNNVLIKKEKMQDFIDPPRIYPLIGPAQLHHSRWKCTVYYTEVRRVGWPIPHTLVDEDTREVLYIDKDHLHMVGNVPAISGG
jgi:hypothetical protein